MGSSGHSNNIVQCIFKNSSFYCLLCSLQMSYCDSLAEWDLYLMLLPAQNPFKSYCFTGFGLPPLSG